MRDVCKECSNEKPKSAGYCYCLKYGCDIRYGRFFCVGFERKGSKQVWSKEDNH